LSQASPDSSARGYRGRFAPTPSGPLHLGSLLTALASFLDARAHQGQWLVRIDDVDPYRARPGAEDHILFSLDALGLHWDGPVMRQSQRLERYQAALSTLKNRGLIYACVCSRNTLAELSGPEGRGIYAGTCLNRPPPAQPDGQALRVRVTDRSIRFEDRVQGPVVQELAREVGDFILFRRDQAFAYHLATVLDDADQGMTNIVRGHDLLESTPRQIYLQELLALPTPRYAHTPILIDNCGRKLSKRTLAPEAETRSPAKILCQLLRWLRLAPPDELIEASPTDILGWAIPHWRLEPLRTAGPTILAETLEP
jgi:glutamyl-Q tRNA(Asp) synthetase